MTVWIESAAFGGRESAGFCPCTTGCRKERLVVVFRANPVNTEIITYTGVDKYRFAGFEVFDGDKIVIFEKGIVEQLVDIKTQEVNLSYQVTDFVKLFFFLLLCKVIEYGNKKCCITDAVGLAVHHDLVWVSSIVSGAECQFFIGRFSRCFKDLIKRVGFIISWSFNRGKQLFISKPASLSGIDDNVIYGSAEKWPPE